MEKINIELQFKVTGHIQVHLFPADRFPTLQSIFNLNPSPAFPLYFYKKIQEYLVVDGSNRVLDIGLDWLKNVLIGAETTNVKLTHIGVGSGTNLVAPTDTELQTPIGNRLALQTPFSGGTGIAKYTGFFVQGDNNGTWKEYSIAWVASGASTIFARKVPGTTITKTTSNTGLVTWTIILTPV